MLSFQCASWSQLKAPKARYLDMVGYGHVESRVVNPTIILPHPFESDSPGDGQVCAGQLSTEF